MPVPRPLGLALSGGGFRATAFHLGVLKRLRELRLLGEVDIVSTVSGGTVAGAAWVYWQAKVGDTLQDGAEWDRFESVLIDFMRSGLRESILWLGLFVPMFVLGAAAIAALAIAAPSLGPWLIEFGRYQIASLAAALVAIFGLAYWWWHHFAGRLFQRALDRTFFNRAILNDLARGWPQPERQWPYLIMNATGLNSGDHLLFSPDAEFGNEVRYMFGRAQAGTISILNLGDSDKWSNAPNNRKLAPTVSMDVHTPLARAVVASCAIPSVFAPLEVSQWLQSPWWAEHFQAVDGGVADNQGTKFLLEGHCRGIIVSDAAAALKTEASPSTWQLLPWGRGVIFRSQDIIFERMRDLGYRRLEERLEYYRLLRDCGGLALAEERHAAILEGFGFVEIWPSDQFRWGEGIRLPAFLHRCLATIRTDLDRFSEIEISALMYHGYTSIDHCLRAYQHDWLSDPAPPLSFRSTVADINIDWATIGDAQLLAHGYHLLASSHRMRWRRSLRELTYRWRYRRDLRMAHARDKQGDANAATAGGRSEAVEFPHPAEQK